MAETVSSVALDSATVVVGVDGAQVQSSTATATSSSTSVAGVAAANAKATNATGIKDSSLTAGEDQSVNATATGSTSATSETVTAGPTVDTTITAISTAGVVSSTSTDINIGDAVVFTTLNGGGSGLNTNQIYYVIASNSGVSYTISETPDGSAVAPSVAYTTAAADLQTSSAAASSLSSSVISSLLNFFKSLFFINKSLFKSPSSPTGLPVKFKFAIFL